jgi:hypothetical protein
MTDPIQPPAPPSRATLATVLIQAAEGAWLVANDPGGDQRLQRVCMANGWRLGVTWLPDDEPALLWATAPDGAHWSCGCDRWPDWGAGPDAVVLKPLQHLLTPEQREQLRQRLLSCSCWPKPDPPPEPPSMAAIEELYPLEVMAS